MPNSLLPELPRFKAEPFLVMARHGAGCKRGGSFRRRENTKPARFVVVSEQFRVPPPADNGAQRRLGVAFAKMILELQLEALPRRDTALALLEHLADVGGERHESQEMFPEKLFALFRLALGKNAPRGC